MRKLTLLMVACCAAIIPALAQENVLREKADAFMQQHKKDLYGFSNDSSSPEALKGHPFVKALSHFLHENADAYATARRKRMQQYAPPPAALTAVQWHKGKDMGSSLDMMNILFVRSFDPYTPAQMVFNVLYYSVVSDTYATAEEGNKYSQARAIYGALLYAKPLTDSTWQIWSADRIFATTFVYNIRTGNVADLKFTMPKDRAYQLIQWPKSMIKPVDESAALEGELIQIKWTKQTRFDKFYQQNEAKFKQARVSNIQPFVKAFTPPAATGYREIARVAELVQDSTTQGIIYPDYWDNYVQTSAIYGSEHAEQMVKSMQMNNLIGASRYAKKLDDDHYEIWTIHDTDRIYFIWNIKTGKIEKQRYWVKE